MKISVNFINQTIVLDLDSSTSIVDLKKKIYEKLRVLTSMQCVMYKGSEMSDDATTLSDYGVTENACFILNLKKHVASSFDRRSVPATLFSTIAEKTRQPDNAHSTKEQSTPGKSKTASRVHFEDNNQLAKNGCPNHENRQVKKFTPEQGLKLSNSSEAPTVSTPQRCSVDLFEVSPILQKDLVLNEAYLTQQNCRDIDDTSNKISTKQVEGVAQTKEALGADLYFEYIVCCSYTSLCKYESLKTSLKYALKAHDIVEAKSIAKSLTDLGYNPDNVTTSSSEMRVRMHLLSIKVRERYDSLADLSNVPLCCICMDAMNNMAILLADNHEDDAIELEYCSIYPSLCRYEMLTNAIKESLREKQISRAKLLQTHLLELEIKCQQKQAGLTAIDLKHRLMGIEERLKERYSSAAERADIEESIYCTELMVKIKSILLEGDKALARPILQDKLEIHNNMENHYPGSSSSSSSSGSGSDTTEKELDSPAHILVFHEEKAVPRHQSYISKYLAATSASSEESAKTVLSGKWWLDDDDKE